MNYISQYDIFPNWSNLVNIDIETIELVEGNKQKTLTKAEYELLAMFRYVLRQFLHFSEEAARAIDLQPQHHQVLLMVKGFPERDWVTIKELADRLQIRHHSAVELVKRLAVQGLLARTHAANDRRQVQISLTIHGAEVLEQLSAVHKAELNQLAPQLISLLTQLTQSHASNAGSLQPEDK